MVKKINLEQLNEDLRNYALGLNYVFTITREEASELYKLLNYKLNMEDLK